MYFIQRDKFRESHKKSYNVPPVRIVLIKFNESLAILSLFLTFDYLCIVSMCKLIPDRNPYPSVYQNGELIFQLVSVILCWYKYPILSQ